MIETQNTFGKILTIVLIGVLVVISIFIFVVLGDNFTSSRESFNETILNASGIQTSLQETPTSLTAQSYNQTWLEFDGVNDVLEVEVNQSKPTISLWFKNDTHDWTNVVKTGEIIYINNISDATWTYFPYYLNGDTIYIGKTNDSTFVNVSIDEFRTYETILNNIEVGEIYNEGY